jgi:Universal stress protein family
VSEVQTGTVRTKVPARLDRLPWSRFHWMIIIGLATAMARVLGAVSQHVLRNAPCPVLVVADRGTDR